VPSERAALIAAIRAAPQDDAVRLVCADWFEEQGDEASVARAEFIRTQVRRACSKPDDEEQSELATRELRLLKKYALAWCGSHFVFRKVRFRRGFIEGVHLHLTHFLHHRRQMFALEPVRDVSLTGWIRAPGHLIRRVAACPEWRHVETLRIHLQGAHTVLPDDLLLLLESPHLIGLRALYGASVVFGGAAFAEHWQGLRSLVMPHDATEHTLRRVMGMPWWDSLTSLEMSVPSLAHVFTRLSSQLPKSLRELRLTGPCSPAVTRRLDEFFRQLGEKALRSLHLRWVPVPAETLARALDGTNNWRLEELSLPGDLQGLPEDYAHVLAQAPGVENLLSLDLREYDRIADSSAAALFSSRHLRSLAHLNLHDSQLSAKGARALANADGWDRLRSLSVFARLKAAEWRRLFASPNLRRLNWLRLTDEGASTSPPDLTAEVARALAALPNLAYLHAEAKRFSPEARRVLSDRDALPWLSLPVYDDQSGWGDYWAAGNFPPLDAALEGGFRGP
jgi:uncharacterized protein (TIGR02996 family)